MSVKKLKKMALIGSIEAFNSKVSDVTTYIERVEQLFLCNEVEESKKVCLFLTLIGGEAYSILKDLVAPALPKDKSYEELKEVLKSHYSPKRLIIAERYKFYTTSQEAHETVTNFSVRLKNLAKFCSFGTFLNDALRDKFVCGLRSESIKRKLLTEDNLTFEKAYQIAVSMEMTEGQIRLMGPETISVNKIGSHQKVKFKSSKSSNGSFSHSHTKSPESESQVVEKKNKCKRCLRTHKDNSRCPAINWKCYSCQKMGHTAKSVLCKNKVQYLEDNGDEEGEQQQEISEDSLELGLLSETKPYPLYSLNFNNNNNSLKIPLLINNNTVVMEVDSGACRSVMHVDDYKVLFANCVLEPVNFKLRVVTGDNVSILGQVYVSVNYKSKSYNLPLVILDAKNNFTPLLGRNWLNIINPEWRNFVIANTIVESERSSLPEGESNIVQSSKNIESVRTKLISEIRSKFSSVFEDKANSCISEFKVNIKLKPDVKPIFHRAYQMAYSLKPKVEMELSKMVESGVLTKVSHSNWASPIVVVPKKILVI